MLQKVVFRVKFVQEETSMLPFETVQIFLLELAVCNQSLPTYSGQADWALNAPIFQGFINFCKRADYYTTKPSVIRI